MRFQESFIQLTLFFCLTVCGFRAFGQVSLPGSGNALIIKDDSDYVAMNKSWNDLEFPFTVMAWIKVDSPLTNQSAPIISSNNSTQGYSGFLVQLVNRADGWKVDATLGNGGGFFAAHRRSKEIDFRRFNEWCHVAVVFHQFGSYSIFLNGKDGEGRYVGGATSFYKDASLPRIGNHYSSPTSIPSFRGAIDEVKIWSNELMENEIRREMCKKSSGNTQGLFAYYKLDDKSAITNEVSGTDEGDVIGQALIETSSAPVGDESRFSYRDNWGNQVFVYDFMNQTIEVRNFSGRLDGFHIYEVHQEPNSVIGLNNMVATSPYLGFFPASTFRDSVDYRVSIKTSCEVTDAAYRHHNADEIWETINTVTGNNNLIWPTANSKELVFNIEDDCDPLIDDLLIPNVFTPNGDGRNDVFRVEVMGYENVHWQVYNRWGNLVFETRDVYGYWDGTYNGHEVAEGVYFLVFSGTTSLGESKVEKATINLFR